MKPILKLHLVFLVSSLLFLSLQAGDDSDYDFPAMYAAEWTDEEMMASPIAYLESIDFEDEDHKWTERNCKQVCIILLQFAGIADPLRKKKSLTIKSDCDLVRVLADGNPTIRKLVGQETTNFDRLRILAEEWLTESSQQSEKGE